MSKDEKIKAQKAVIEYLKGELQIMTAKYNTMADAFHNLIKDIVSEKVTLTE